MISGLKQFMSRPMNQLGLACAVAGVFLLAVFIGLTTWQDEQTQYYNAGIAAYNSGNMEGAVEMFEASYQAYVAAKSNSNQPMSPILPKPRVRLALLAKFQQAKAMVRLEKSEAAIEQFSESIRLSDPEEIEKTDASSAEQHLIAEDRLTAQYDLELLLKNSSQSKKKQPKDSEPKQSPAEKPANGSGSGKESGL